MRNNNNAKNQANAQAKNKKNENVEFSNDFANKNAKNKTNKLDYQSNTKNNFR